MTAIMEIGKVKGILTEQWIKDTRRNIQYWYQEELRNQIPDMTVIPSVDLPGINQIMWTFIGMDTKK